MVLTFREGAPAEVALHPVEQVPGGKGIRLASEPEARDTLAVLAAQSQLLGDPERYAQAWASFCDQRRDGFLTHLWGFGKWLQRLNRNEWMFRHLTQADVLRIYNLISCESHRSALRASLDHLIERQVPPAGGER